MNSLEIGGIPCVIREIFDAPPCPEEVAVLFEVALTHHNTSNYSMAVEAYMQAQQRWETELMGQFKQADAVSDACMLPMESQLFLRLAIGSVFESAGQDEQALAEYLDAKRLAAVEVNFPPTHPINATVESAIGTVYVHTAQFDLASDHYLKALSLRERVLGPRHVDTALVLNNVGVCLHCLDRTADALELYTKAEDIFKQYFALEHPRLVTVRRNIQRAKQHFLKNSTFEMPQHKTVKIPFIPGAIRSKQFTASLEAKKGKGKGKKAK